MHTVSVISVDFICKYLNEAEQQYTDECNVERYSSSLQQGLIAVNWPDRAFFRR